MAQHFGQVGYRRALAGAHVEAAGGDAGQQAAFRGEPQQLAEAEPGIKVIARARRDLRFRGIWSLNDRRALRPGGERISGWMDDDRVHRDALVDILAQLEQALLGMVAGIQSQGFPDFKAFLFVQAQHDVEVLLESRN